jgi:hypothetical protein
MSELLKTTALHPPHLVMAGLVPAISVRRAQRPPKRDARDKPAHDEGVWDDCVEKNISS